MIIANWLCRSSDLVECSVAFIPFCVLIRRTQYYLVIVQQVRTNALGVVVEPSVPLTEFTLAQLLESTGMVRKMFEQPGPVGKRQLQLLPVYIAANTSTLGDKFVVGDGGLYGDYQNYKLQANYTYRVAVAFLIENQQVRFACQLTLSKALMVYYKATNVLM